MKKAIQSKTIWFNTFLMALPFILQILEMVDIDLLTALGIKSSESVLKILSFTIGAINIFLRMRTTLPIGKNLVEDMYDISLSQFRNNITLDKEGYENLWIVINCPDCIAEYNVTPLEQSQINLAISHSFPDSSVFNADKKPYPKGKF